jgi:hypothetical protein
MELDCENVLKQYDEQVYAQVVFKAVLGVLSTFHVTKHEPEGEHAVRGQQRHHLSGLLARADWDGEFMC